MKVLRRDLKMEDIVGFQGWMRWLYLDKENNVINIMVKSDLKNKENNEQVNSLNFKGKYVLACMDLDMEAKNKIFEEQLKDYTPRLFYKGSGSKYFVEYEVKNIKVVEEGIRINLK